MRGGFEFPPLMGVEKTAEFLLVQVSNFLNIQNICIDIGDIIIAYDRKENRFYRPSPDEINGWTEISLGAGRLYVRVPLAEPDAEMLRKHCAQALNNAQEYDRVLKNSVVDPLTELLNKRALCERLEEEIARCSRSFGSFCVAFFDVDNLKEINDAYGHLTGDSVLKGVAAAIKRHLRRSDVVGRFGGDEFVALLIDALLCHGEAVVNRLLERISHEVNVGKTPVSVSAGVACYPDDGSSSERLIEVADRRMYEIKLSRRGVKR